MSNTPQDPRSIIDIQICTSEGKSITTFPAQAYAEITETVQEYATGRLINDNTLCAVKHVILKKLNELIQSAAISNQPYKVIVGRYCPMCAGSGFKDERRCNYCDGNGMLTV